MLRGRRKWVLAGTLFIFLIAATYSWWLPLPGQLLVKSDGPSKADGLIVLGGDVAGYRLQAAGELVQGGYAPIALVSGNNWYYGLWECEVAIDFAVRNGQPREAFEPFRIQANSTDEEIQLLFAEAQRRGWKSILIVTSNYHTRRTGILVNRYLPPGVQVRLFGAPDRYFQPDQWWWHRESRKTLFYEWTKMLAVLAGGL